MKKDKRRRGACSGLVYKFNGFFEPLNLISKIIKNRVNLSGIALFKGSMPSKFNFTKPQNLKWHHLFK